MEQLIVELSDALHQAQLSGGSIAASGVALMYVIKAFRSDVVQNLLPAKAQWINLPQWAKYAIPFVGAGVGSVLISIGGGGMSVAALIVSGLTAALTAIGIHIGAKTVALSADSKKKIEELRAKVLDLSLPK